jgi:hypothetical protein
VSRLDNIVKRNQRALRDTRHKLLWVGAIVLALVGIAIAVSAGLARPNVPHREAVPVDDHKRVNGILLR